MRGVNKVILVGTLGKDPEVRFTPSGVAACNFSMATNDSWKDKQTGEKIEKTEWHRCVAFSKLAEIIGEHLKKGSNVYIEGKLQTRKWQDAQGQDKYTTEIKIDEMQMLGGRQAPQSAGGADNDAAQSYPPAAPDAGDGFDDDVPF